jgi:hypothetical protein
MFVNITQNGEKALVIRRIVKYDECCIFKQHNISIALCMFLGLNVCYNW